MDLGTETPLGAQCNGRLRHAFDGELVPEDPERASVLDDAEMSVGRHRTAVPSARETLGIAQIAFETGNWEPSAACRRRCA